MGMMEDILKMKQEAPILAASPEAVRNNALLAISDALKENAEKIFRENDKDIENAKKKGVSDSVMKRLVFNEGKLRDVVSGIKQLVLLEDPLGKITLHRQLDEGLMLRRITCPIGVIGVIFEARPDALVQISTLCIKSGNCAVLKGGSETANTNKVLFEIIKDCVVKAGLPENAYIQAELHSEIDELLKCHNEVDLLIPRGSNEFVSYIMNNTKIPVMGHADGICHIYVDEKADMKKTIPIIADAKTQYTAACNAVETILVNRSIMDEFLKTFDEEMKKRNVRINGTSEVKSYIDVNVIDEEDFKEYLDLELSVKPVSDVYEAVRHINRFGSHHTDCIITEDDETAAVFMQLVDSAGVYRNCSTRFADGFRYGFGAEVGISTGKLHARGPVGLEGLVTYKYRLEGDGHIVGDYASGKKQFNFKDMK